MESEVEKKWFGRIGKLNVILSIAAAVIEIGIFGSYVAEVVTVEVAALSGLVVAVVFVFQYSWRSRKLVEAYKTQLLASRDFPAVAAYLSAMQSLPKEFRTDRQILYDEIEVTYSIDKADAIYTRRTIGQNVSKNNLERMVYRACGETSIENGRLRPKAFRILEGNEKEKLDPVVVWASSNVKVIGADFNTVVAPRGGKFDVTFSAKWEGAFVSRYDYAFVSLCHCVEEVKKLKVNVIFKESVSRCSVWTFDLKRHTLEELEKITKPRRKRNKYTITWERAHPNTNMIYIFRFKRSRN